MVPEGGVELGVIGLCRLVLVRGRSAVEGREGGGGKEGVRDKVCIEKNSRVQQKDPDGWSGVGR